MNDPWAVIGREQQASPKDWDEPSWGEPPTIEDESPVPPPGPGSPAVEGEGSQPPYDEPPWEVHARELQLPPLLFPPPQLLQRLPPQPQREQSAQPDKTAPQAEVQPERQRSRSRNKSPPQAEAQPQRQRSRSQHDYSSRFNPNPTAIRGWKDETHVENALREAGLPAPHTMYRHQAGFMRYTAKSAIINYYATTRTVLVQGREAGRWDEKLRAVRVQTRR